MISRVTVLPTTILSTTPPKTIIGSTTIPYSAPGGAYILNVTTADGGTNIQSGTFTVGYVAIPTISSLAPVSGPEYHG